MGIEGCYALGATIAYDNIETIRVACGEQAGRIPNLFRSSLMQHEEVLGIAEGIETALSASVLFNVPVWSALTAGLLQEWTPPASVSTVLIFGDNDVSNTGQAAAYTLAQRLKAGGLTVSVEMPQMTGCDWNDVHQRSLRASA